MIVRDLGLIRWKNVFFAMNDFTKKRNIYTKDEIWFVQHFPIFTLGQKFILKKNTKKNIPLIHTNRGGDITYHGPGQQIIYFLINIKCYHLSPHRFIKIIQDSVIETLKDFSIIGNIKKKSPGIYINNKKICSIGLRIVNGCSMHGISINVNMNLSPFNLINPCGDKNLKMVQMKDFCSKISIFKLKSRFLHNFKRKIKIRKIIYKDLKNINLF